MKPLTIKDLYRTPRHIVSAIERALNVRIGWDVCADHNSNVAPTGHYFGLDKGQDSLGFWWYKRLPKLTVCFMNPPYSQIPAWANKAKVEASRGLIVVGLLPDMRSSMWFQSHVEGHASLCLLPDGRINFESLDPVVKVSGNPWPSCAPVWTPWTTGHTQYVRFSRKLPR